MNYFAQLRQNYIKEIIETRGVLNRADLMNQFGISVPQASLDINKFLANHPDSMIYNRSLKRYEKA